MTFTSAIKPRWSSLLCNKLKVADEQHNFFNYWRISQVNGCLLQVCRCCLLMLHSSEIWERCSQAEGEGILKFFALKVWMAEDVESLWISCGFSTLVHKLDSTDYQEFEFSICYFHLLIKSIIFIIICYFPHRW